MMEFYINIKNYIKNIILQNFLSENSKERSNLELKIEQWRFKFLIKTHNLFR